ncbi:hypothetical protein DFR70_112165 [Nocardia tenerifensis]|uniref:Uncharacterized protein n=1 Tax=Nocardia tenerifensis TaxID=228006 RepID=A0A318JYS5_9NOCA|nr:hypothetical protein DFR70_112165 [Nocardia tenerifensis]
MVPVSSWVGCRLVVPVPSCAGRRLAGAGVQLGGVQAGGAGAQLCGAHAGGSSVQLCGAHAGGAGVPLCGVHAGGATVPLCGGARRWCWSSVVRGARWWCRCPAVWGRRLVMPELRYAGQMPVVSVPSCVGAQAGDAGAPLCGADAGGVGAQLCGVQGGGAGVPLCGAHAGGAGVRPCGCTLVVPVSRCAGRVGTGFGTVGVGDLNGYPESVPATTVDRHPGSTSTRPWGRCSAVRGAHWWCRCPAMWGAGWWGAETQLCGSHTGVAGIEQSRMVVVEDRIATIRLCSRGRAPCWLRQRLSALDREGQLAPRHCPGWWVMGTKGFVEWGMVAAEAEGDRIRFISAYFRRIAACGGVVLARGPLSRETRSHDQ